jgi:transcriptional regulator with XRE-family HTH domain
MNSAFGIYLKKLRIQRGLSLKNVEDSLGLSASYVHRLETGNRCNPSAQVLKMIGEFYNVNGSELLELVAGQSNPTIGIEDYIRLTDDDVIQSLLNQILKRVFELSTKLDSVQ